MEVVEADLVLNSHLDILYYFKNSIAGKYTE